MARPYLMRKCAYLLHSQWACSSLITSDPSVDSNHPEPERSFNQHDFVLSTSRRQIPAYQQPVFFACAVRTHGLPAGVRPPPVMGDLASQAVIVSKRLASKS